jgi:hypothetical protein
MLQIDKRPLIAIGACEAIAQLLFMIGASHLPGKPQHGGLLQDDMPAGWQQPYLVSHSD